MKNKIKHYPMTGQLIVTQLSPPCLNNLVVLKNSKYSFRCSNIVEIPRAKTTTYGKNSLNIQLLFFGMTYLMMLEKLPILTNLKTFYYHGMAMNANVMHVNNFNIKVFLNFIFLYYLYLFIF